MSNVTCFAKARLTGPRAVFQFRCCSPSFFLRWVVGGTKQYSAVKLNVNVAHEVNLVHSCINISKPSLRRDQNCVSHCFNSWFSLIWLFFLKKNTGTRVSLRNSIEFYPGTLPSFRKKTRPLPKPYRKNIKKPRPPTFDLNLDVGLTKTKHPIVCDNHKQHEFQNNYYNQTLSYSKMCLAMTTRKTTVTKTPTMRKRQRRVRFSAAPTNHYVNDLSRVFEHRSFLSEEEIQECWYSKNEEQSFKHDAMREMFFYKQGLQNGADPARCPRGLEKHTRQRRLHKKETLGSVLTAHRFGLDAEQLAQFSRQRTSWSKMLASTQGSLDQMEVLIDTVRERKEQ